MTKQEIQRLAAMFRTVSDPATKPDCASVTIVTPPGELTVEYGAFRDGDVLNVPTGGSDHEATEVLDRVDREPIDTDGSVYVVYDVDDLTELDAAELVFDASAGWSDLEIVEAELKTVEWDGLMGKIMDWFRPRSEAEA